MGAFVLTSENYYSQEANKEYLSVSQYKQFVGTYGRRGCEFTALEELNGRWQQKKNSGMMIGSYVDSYVEGTLDEFKKNNPEIFKKDGTLKADFTKAEQVIARIERWREAGHYDRRAFRCQVEDQDGQLFARHGHR